MKPRLSSSKKWTPFPKEYLEQIESVFFENFEPNLVDRQLLIEGKIYPQEILLRVGFLEQGKIRQVNFEVSVDYSRDQQDAVERIYDCLDAAASMMADYFENEESMNFPLTWREYDFKGNKVYLQHSTTNSKLEQEADALLGIDTQNLVNEELEDEDALSRAEEKIEAPDEDSEIDDWGDDLGDPDEEEEDEVSESRDTSRPTMFSGTSKLNKKKNNLH